MAGRRLRGKILESARKFWRYRPDAHPVALVLMMTVPGLGLFYGGMVRKKNVGDTVMTSLR